jgi:hypothetical protein
MNAEELLGAEMREQIDKLRALGATVVVTISPLGKFVTTVSGLSEQDIANIQRDKSPLTYAETVDFVRAQLLDGIDRGRPLVEILEVAVLDALPVPDREAILAALKRIDEGQIAYWKSHSNKYGKPAEVDDFSAFCEEVAGKPFRFSAAQRAAFDALMSTRAKKANR